MAIKFQYNKTALQSLNKQLNIRIKALPVIKNKETALRLEVKKAKIRVAELNENLNQQIEKHSVSPQIWVEFNDELLSICEVKTQTKKIAGVKTPILDQVIFNVKDYNLYQNPKWYPQGISTLKELGCLALESAFYSRKMELLEYARRKTTQKVNLYERVQIPAYTEAIRKIKRFLEDEENLSKSSQKIVKNRQSIEEVEL